MISKGNLVPVILMTAPVCALPTNNIMLNDNNQNIFFIINNILKRMIALLLQLFVRNEKMKRHPRKDICSLNTLPENRRLSSVEYIIIWYLIVVLLVAV